MGGSYPPYPPRPPMLDSEKKIGATCTYCQRIGHVWAQCRKRKIVEGQVTENMAHNIDDESWIPGNLSIDPYASPSNHTYQADDHENSQGHISSLASKTAVNGLPVYVSEDQPQCRSARLGEKEAAGKKVTWEPRTQAPMEWDTAPTSSTRATGVPLARQPQPPSPPPPQPSILQDPSSRTCRQARLRT